MTPYDLLNKLNDAAIDYGWWDGTHDKIIRPGSKEFDDSDHFEQHCVVQHPQDVYRRKIGTCWDLTLLEYEALEKAGYKPGVIYLESNILNKAQQPALSTHTLVYYKEPKSNAWYWFEYSWYQFIGIHGPYGKDTQLFEKIKAHVTLPCRHELLMWKQVNLATFRRLYAIPRITCATWLAHTRDS